MNKFMLLLLLVTAGFCYNKNETVSSDDFKCSLPDVTTVDDNLDISRFRADFAKISEVKFPGIIGPTNEHLICKIKCIDGNWVGPLCSQTPIKSITDGRFQPVFRECLYRNQNPLLAVAFKNDSILIDTYFPHGSVIVARCKHFGLYKLTGENMLRCENGEWSSKMPQCVPTSVITNYTGGAPPTIQYIAVTGSAIVELSGELYVYPGSTVWLDCLWPQSMGKPDWSWTQLYRHHAEWASHTGETDLHYRLVLNRVSARHSDSYTCTSPAGNTNTVAIKVVNIVCPPINVSSPHVHQFAQGTRLGNAVHFSCQPGYHLNGSAIVNCMGDGRWSSQPPTCVETFCPVLRTLGNHLSVVEYNSSYGGRAVFACSWGYRLIGAPGLECELDGKWSGEMPHCIAIYCPDPLVPEKGRLLTTATSKDGKYPVGDLIIYSCEEGYEIVGEASIVCTENGFWSHPPPFCLPPSEIKKSDTIYIDNTTLVNFEE
ncbi:locomotion-related protein Hikaru genki isoform X1 [Vanessa tameamea]|uniref:Locomotion-related protein Hikaru genki isoform X1 n=1 Tax=Vanessa tameamea TaxID=334116 RepID=A0A8B8IVA5_VANTA|nr:locomotion-related protein Hikaru genki isoform X1 [Vanessa tameamea]XP_047543548.1 locomotion-related protein Hikaru genki isoform X1 [Vanessa atalanta]